jgi:hypothetical protein
MHETIKDESGKIYSSSIKGVNNIFIWNLREYAIGRPGITRNLWGRGSEDGSHEYLEKLNETAWNWVSLELRGLLLIAPDTCRLRNRFLQRRII